MTEAEMRFLKSVRKGIDGMELLPIHITTYRCSGTRHCNPQQLMEIVKKHGHAFGLVVCEPTSERHKKMFRWAIRRG